MAVNQTEEKWKLAYSEEENSWIIYRLLNKSEAEAHLATFDKQMATFNNQKVLWENVRDNIKPAPK